MLVDGIQFVEGSTPTNLVLPNVTAEAIGVIDTPRPGEVVYQTTGTVGLYVYTGTAWTKLTTASDIKPVEVKNLPPFTGDVFSVTGSSVLTLKSMTSPGTYTKLAVDEKGRVVSGTTPTTIEGLGVSDVYTKSYIDNRFNSINAVLSINGKGGEISKLVPGDILGLAPSATIDTTNASNISSGKIALSTLPNYTGDVVSAGATLSLATLLTVPGTFNKVTANSRGMITSASLEKTLAGIGIIDAINVNMIPTKGNAKPRQLVLGNDTRLGNKRDPNPHTHMTSDIISLDVPINAAVNAAVTTLNATISSMDLRLTAGINSKQNTSAKDTPNGYVGLTSNGKIDTNYLPPMLINNVMTATTLEERNALVAGKSDIAVVTGTINKTYILRNLPATDNNNWVEMAAPVSGVTTVNGNIGAVVVDFSNIGGTLKVESMPATGVTAGAYNKVTVDAKGRITSATNESYLTSIPPVDTYTKAESDYKLALKVDRALSNAPNGFAGLDSNGKVDLAILQGITLNPRHVIDTLEDRTTLQADIGDAAIVLGTTNKTYILVKQPVSDTNNWVELVSSGATKVLSINGKDGTVQLTLADLTGVLAAASLPAFTGGDVTSAAGSTSLVLKDVVTPGTYNKVTINAKGLVVSAENTEGTGNSLDAAKIVAGTLSDARLSTNVVLTNDPRLTDSRTPLPHTSQLITDFSTAVAGAITTATNTPGTIAFPVSSVNTKTGDVVITKTDFNLGNVDNTSDANKPISTVQQAALDLKESLSNKGNPNGYVGLGSNGKIDSKYLSSVALGSRYTVVSITERNALTAAVGDIAIVGGDVNKTYMLNALPATTAANWLEMLSPTGSVSSINGSSGDVLLDLVSIPGTLPATKLPGFTGDVISTERTNTLTLSPTGISPGTYNSVTVDDKGRVTAGTNDANVSEISNASRLTTGLLSVARLPELTGEVTATAGTGSLSLVPTGVAPGTYTSITVDAKGRVTGGTNPPPPPATDASTFTTGTLNASRLPPYLGGDVTASGGSSNLELAYTGVMEGTYNSVSVDRKGRVLTGASIPVYSTVEADTKYDGKIDKGQINQPNGVVGLNGSSKINAAYLPSMIISSRFVAETLAERNALTATVGDIAIVGGSVNKTYILNATPASNNANWLEMLNPTGGITSFNGMTGDVTFGANDIQSTLKPEVMPAFSGDATSPEGEAVLTLKNVATAGTYNQVTIDSKGRVLTGENVNWIADGSSITRGTINDARLSTNVVLTTDPRLSDTRDPKPHTASLITDFTQATLNVINSAGISSGGSGGAGGSGGGAVASVNGQIGAITLTKTDIGLGNVDNTPDLSKPISTSTAAALALREVKTSKNAPGGYVGLNDAGKIDTSYLPAFTMNTRFAVNTLSQRNALSANVGDVAIVAGTVNKTFVLNALPASSNDNWLELLSPTGSVSSINNMSGDVSLTLTNITGILPSTKLPALAGDVSSVSGSNVLTLTNTGVIAGTYTSVTVDRKGRVIAGGSNSAMDLSTAELNANNILTGTIPIGRLPAFNGDVTSINGINTLTLSNTGVNPGTYNSVTVDAKGRVTAGTSQQSGSGNASDLAAGTVPAARLPAFTGDVISNIGTTELSLSYTGVAAGTYTSVTVDSKGRVITGSTSTTYSADEIDNKLAAKIGTETANAPLGYVKLNENGKIESSLLSAMSLNNSTVVSTLVARNALNANVGDIAIVAGTVNKSFILSALPPTADSNWLEMLNPTGGVTAINGQTGVVAFGYDNLLGTVPPTSLPPFVGDVSSNGNIVSLIPTGVTAGTYNKVSVDAKGRVTSASSAATLADLGITDAVSSTLLPTSGDATASQIVKGDDSRLTNSRAPTAHVHEPADITGLQNFVDTSVQAGVTTIRGGVPTAGNTLNKLYDLVVTGINEIIVPTLSARDALDIPNTKTQVFVENDGDGEWALYKATSTGVNASFVKLSDPNIINAIVGVTVESTANKDADTTLTSNSDVKYPTQKAVKTYVDQHLINKVSTYDFSSALAGKADTSYVNSVTDNKADTSYVDIGLLTKIDKTMLPVGTSNATVDQLVKGNDTRLTDAREPLPHTASYITNFSTAVNSLVGSAITTAMQNYSGGVQSINGLNGNVTVDKVTVGLNFVDNTSDLDKPLSTAATVALADKESLANKNVINGYVGLNSSGKIDALYLPSMTMNNRFVRETLEERNLLNATIGDIAIITGITNKTFILNALPPTNDGSWLEMSNPLDGVTSINGLTGTVSLTLSDIGGVVPVSKLPNYIGDVTSVTGGNVLTLAPSGVTAGTYNQVTVDAKGRVVGAVNVDTLTRNAANLTYGTLPAERLPQFESTDIYSTAGTNALYLSQTGVAPGTYNNVTVDSKGRIIRASTEQYYNTNASTLDTGTLPIERLPAFAGDITTSVGSNATVLSNTGVVAGTYNNVTVDRKGRVTSGTTTAVYTTSQVDTKLAAKLDVSKANAANGYVALNSSLKIDQTYLPAITINSRYVASSLQERNALSARIGDIAIVGGEINRTYILNAIPASVDESWIELVNPLSGVMSVNGKTSIVTLDISELPGTLNVSSLPSFAGGDVTSNDGSSVLTLKNSGVTAGLYNVIQVNAKGLITSGTNASTLDGIGITDAYTKTEVNNLLSPKLTSTSSLNANRLTSGTISDSVLNDIVEAGSYLSISVDTKGRVIGGLKSNNTPSAGQVFLASDSTQGYWGAVPSGTNASTLSTGTLNSSRLPNSGISAGTYNNVTVDVKGRVTAGISADNTPSPNQIFVTSGSTSGSWIDIPSSTNASALTSGTLNSSLLPNTGVTSGRYANVTVDSKGRVTGGMSASNTATSGQIFVANNSSSGAWTTIPPATNASELTTGTLSSTLLPNTGVIDGNYVGVTIDAKGRALSGITATNTPLPGQVFVAQTTSSGKWMTYTSGGGGGGGSSTDASLLTSGTIDPARLPTSGISASSITTGTLTAAQLPTMESAGTYTSVVVDEKGRVTGGGKLDSIQLSILKRNRVPVTYNAAVMSDTTGTPNTISLSILKRDKSIVSYNVSL